MFSLIEAQDTVTVAPHDFDKPRREALEAAINKKFNDKVLTGAGLCIRVWELLTVGDSFVFPGDGSNHTHVKFKHLVFRPFEGEILEGKVLSSSSEGVRITLGFFDNIYIPAHLLQDPSEFDDKEKVWVWTFDGHPLYMDLEEPIRFRVDRVEFPTEHHSIPPPPVTPSHPGGKGVLVPTEATTIPPMKIWASINKDGLGLTSWWS